MVPGINATIGLQALTARWQFKWGESSFIDFGMVGRMRPEIRTGLRELLIGISLKDTARVVRAYQILGVLLPGADTALLERAESELFNRFWG